MFGLDCNELKKVSNKKGQPRILKMIDIDFLATDIVTNPSASVFVITVIYWNGILFLR